MNLGTPAAERCATGWRGSTSRCSGPEQTVGELSGGNQQKVALGRLLHQQADVLLLDEPTRGVDVGSKAEIYRLIGELAAQGKAVLFVSSYLPELLGICDRLAVMARGRLSEMRPVDEWNAEQVLAFATGADRNRTRMTRIMRFGGLKKKQTQQNYKFLIPFLFRSGDPLIRVIRVRFRFQSLEEHHECCRYHPDDRPTRSRPPPRCTVRVR